MYLLLVPYVDLLALTLAVVFIDIEPIMQMFVFRAGPLHGILHSLIGALFIAAPVLILVCRFFETRTRFLVQVFSIVGWNPELRRVSVKTTTLSVYLGIASHLLLDYWMHSDIPVFYPFAAGNPFQSSDLMVWSLIALFIGLIVSPILWLIGKHVFKYKSFHYFP